MKAVAERNTSYGTRVIDGDYSRTAERMKCNLSHAIR